MKKFALIGKKLGHSYSQRWFEELFAREHLEGYSYSLVEMPTLEGLRDWVWAEHISGFNVTVPYKQEIIPLLDELDETAATIGAVNCVTVEEGRLVGHNTDAPAFLATLSSFITHHSSLITQSFILGTGGAARAVAYALGQLGIEYTFVSRHPERLKVKGERYKVIGYKELSNFQFPISTLIVNATPVGMYPAVDKTPLDFNIFQFPFFLPASQALSTTERKSNPAKKFQFVYDLIYNPSPTRLLREAAARGLLTKDGLEMLHRQAELSWQWFQHSR